MDETVEVVALPLIFEQFRSEHQSPDELLAAVKIYNAIPAERGTRVSRGDSTRLL